LIDAPEVPPVRATSSGAPKVPRSSISYAGFATTLEGREYSLRVTGELAPRNFLMLIPHAAFASRGVRFQDAPDICFARLQRELAADPELLPDTTKLVLSAADFLEYKVAHEKAAPGPKKRTP
jgi:hypothetical protein